MNPQRTKTHGNQAHYPQTVWNTLQHGSFKDSLKRIAFDIKEYIKLKDSNPDVIPLSGLYEKELADALPHMFENAEIDYSEVEIDELRKSVKKTFEPSLPVDWTL